MLEVSYYNITDKHKCGPGCYCCSGHIFSEMSNSDVVGNMWWIDVNTLLDCHPQFYKNSQQDADLKPICSDER